MSMPRKVLGERGPDSNPTWNGLLEKRGERVVQRDDHETNEVAFVTDYDHLRNRVSVVYAVSPNMQPIRDVPVADQGGFARIYRGLGRNIGTTEGQRRTMGLLVFPKLNARRAFESYRRGLPPNQALFAREGAIFMPTGLPVDDTALPNNPPNVVATAGTATEIGPDDIALVDWETGAGLIIKPGGRVVIAAVGSVDVLPVGASEASLAQIVRTGDSGDGGPGVGTLTGSGFLRST